VRAITDQTRWRGQVYEEEVEVEAERREEEEGDDDDGGVKSIICKKENLGGEASGKRGGRGGPIRDKILAESRRRTWVSCE